MNAPLILLRKDLGRRPYKMRCRFEIEADHTRGQLEKARKVALNKFIADIGKRGWEYVERIQPRITGPYPNVQPGSSLPKPQRVSAKRMLPEIMQGNKFRGDTRVDGIQSPEPIDATEWVQYEIEAYFVHDTILVDTPDLHEEMRPRW